MFYYCLGDAVCLETALDGFAQGVGGVSGFPATTTRNSCRASRIRSSRVLVAFRINCGRRSAWLGKLQVDEIVVPNTAGAFVLGWRWDCEETAQVWNNCADIQIVSGKRTVLDLDLHV